MKITDRFKGYGIRAGVGVQRPRHDGDINAGVLIELTMRNLGSLVTANCDGGVRLKIRGEHERRELSGVLRWIADTIDANAEGWRVLESPAAIILPTSKARPRRGVSRDTRQTASSVTVR